MVKRICCYCKGSVFNSQHPHGVSLSPRVPGMNVAHRCACRQNTHIHEIIKINQKFKKVPSRTQTSQTHERSHCHFLAFVGFGSTARWCAGPSSQSLCVSRPLIEGTL